MKSTCLHFHACVSACVRVCIGVFGSGGVHCWLSFYLIGKIGFLQNLGLYKLVKPASYIVPGIFYFPVLEL